MPAAEVDFGDAEFLLFQSSKRSPENFIRRKFGVDANQFSGLRVKSDHRQRLIVECLSKGGRGSEGGGEEEEENEEEE